MTDLTSALELIETLITKRTFKKERLAEDDVRSALTTLGHGAAHAGAPFERLDALSTLGKASAVSVPIADAAKPLIVAALDSPLPTLGTWGNADDRFYLAKAVAVGEQSWIAGYAAEQLAAAEIAEQRSRDLWAEIAIGRAQTLAAFLTTTVNAVDRWLTEQERDVDVAYRKLGRLVVAISQTLLTADVPTGAGFGKATTALIHLAGGGTSSATLRLREETAVVLLDLVVQVLRLRYELRFDSDIYRAVGAIRRWWEPARPPTPVEAKVDRVAHQALEALHVLVKQGVKDTELRSALVRSLDVARVTRIATTLTEGEISLGPADSKWLTTGQELTPTRNSQAAQELKDHDVDVLVANALIVASSQDLSPAGLESIAGAVELFEPAQAASLSRSAGRLGALLQAVSALAQRRRLSTLGTRGEIVPYDPNVHDAANSLQRGSNVRFVAPGVIRTAEGRSPEIILKAIVEKA